MPPKAKKEAKPKVQPAGATRFGPMPESFLKKQKTVAALNAKAAAKAAVDAKKRKQTRSEITKRAAKYHKEYQSTAANLVRMRREAKSYGNFFVEDEPKVLLVVRIRGINAVEPRTTKILQLLRLRQIHNAVFLRCNKATLNMLRLVAPYVTYGSPNLKTVRELVYKRGFGKVNRQRIPITDNSVVESVLGKHGLICAEDVVHEIFTCGDNFKAANNFLWPFKLSSPLGGLFKKRISFIEGGDYGNRETKINAFVRKMI